MVSMIQLLFVDAAAAAAATSTANKFDCRLPLFFTHIHSLYSFRFFSLFTIKKYMKN